MKKLFLLTMASLMAVCVMAAGRNDGSTYQNAIDFDWDKGLEHPGGKDTLWYRVDLAPLYEEDNPSLTLYLTNPSRDKSVNVFMEATVAMQKQSEKYTIAPHQYKTYTANANLLVRAHQTEILLKLWSDSPIKFSAKVFETADLDETCQDAKALKWNTVATQTKGYAAWWKVDLKDIKDTANYKKDAKVTITNIGTGKVEVKAGQSMDCPSSGLTKRSYTLEAGDFIEDTIPQSMILSVQPDELYFSIENIDQPVSIKVEMVDQPKFPIISETEEAVELHVTDTMVIPAGRTLYKISVADMDSINKYEPEFTYRNQGSSIAQVAIKMAFERPAFGTSNTDWTLAPGEEEIVVYKKNMLEGMSTVDSIYLLTITDQDINFYGRYKHVREGKACKTNIDFNWETGHVQEGRTTQWYAVSIAEARDDLKDIVTYVINEGNDNAKIKASMAFSCPYIDLQEAEKTLKASTDTFSYTLVYSTYALMSDTVWIGLETNQPIRFWADTVSAEKKAVADTACLHATPFNWEDGIKQNAGDTIWYRVNMNDVRESKAKFPTLFMQNLSTTDTLHLTTEQSLECPDEMANEIRTIVIAPNGSYTSKLSRNLFEHIAQDELYVRITGDQEFALQVRLTEEAQGASCASAIPFNWQAGNLQEANANLWYLVDLRNVMKLGNDLKLHLENRDNAECKGMLQLAYNCPIEDGTTIRNFTLGAKQVRDATVPNSMFETVADSLIYINIQGSTALRLWADTLAVEPFDTITGEGITPTKVKWDVICTQWYDEDTVWYVIRKSEIDKIREMDEKVKPVIHINNLGTEDQVLQAEVAYAFPITKKMMSKTHTLKGSENFVDTIPVGMFDQMLTKDSVLFRIIRKSGSSNFTFRIELIKAFNGNTPHEAVLLQLGKQYKQAENSRMWYRIRPADWKKDLSLHGKSMLTHAINEGTGDAEVTVKVYEDVSLKNEMLESFGLPENQHKVTIKKGEDRSHNIPAFGVFGAGNVDLYVMVQTTQPLSIETSFSDYAPKAADPAQQEAVLAVPNVDYTIPAGTTWFRACVPYIRNNFKLVDASNIEARNLGNKKANIKVMATFQDTLVYNVPERSRAIDANASVKGTFKALIDSALVRGGYNFSVAGTQEAFIDSMIRKFVTADSVTAYVRVTTDQPLYIRINTPQTTGDDCTHFMDFDWEHGNVNPKGQTTWLRVQLDENRVPEGKDLKLHLDNWSEGTATVNVDLYPGDCSSTKAASINHKMTNDTARVIERQLLEAWGWTNLMFQYTSDSATHIWAEVVDQAKRDTIRKDLDTVYVCPNTVFTDEYDFTLHTIDPTDPSTWTWETKKDSINMEEAKFAVYIFTYHVLPLQAPDTALYQMSSLMDYMVIKRGEAIQYADAVDSLYAQLTAADADSIMDVLGKDSVLIEYSTDGKNFGPIPATAIASEAVAVRYGLVTECSDTIYGTPYYNTVRYNDSVEVCRSYTWEGKTYTASTVVEAKPYPLINGCDSIPTLVLTIIPPLTDTVSVKHCNEYKWFMNGDSVMLYKPGTYSDTVSTVDGQCDSINTLILTLTHPTEINLSLVSKYGDRILMINRNEINAIDGWNLDIDNDTSLVEWYREAAPKDEFLGYGYYYTLNGEVLPAGVYYAIIRVDDPANPGCGLKAETQHYTVKAVAGAPALVPALARPGETIKVLNLDPEQETVIRVYTTEGLVQATYTVSGENTYTIQAANAPGFYIVELSADGIQSTLRYIVK